MYTKKCLSQSKFLKSTRAVINLCYRKVQDGKAFDAFCSKIIETLNVVKKSFANSWTLNKL